MYARQAQPWNVSGEGSMQAPKDRQESARGIPRLAPGCDPTRLPLSPEEGFLLSRIDGRTPWALLREIAGFPSERVDRCMERWLGEGILELEIPGAPAPPPGQPEATSERLRDLTAERELDPSLDLPVETQRRILEYEGRLNEPYHELLGLGRDPDVRAIKRAYFNLSREFHPDRYFRKNVGPFADSLDRIFRKILEAYEVMMDPVAREELQRSLAQSQPTSPAAPPDAPAGPRIDPALACQRLGKFSKHAKVLAARKKKAKDYFETGMGAFSKERWLEAAASVRLAIAFDPRNEAYREAFGRVQLKAHQERATQLLREGEGALEVRDYAQALRAFEEAARFRPHDPELQHRVASLALKTGEDLRKAKEFAHAACELSPDVASFRRTLGQVYKAAGLTANARRELSRALELDPADSEAQIELGSLGRG
jgi:curved DNA-binding protein CbpA